MRYGIDLISCLYFIHRLLLDGGADPNAVDEDKDTPLHYACSSGNVEIISLLLAKGADPTAADGLGRTPAERSTGTSVQRLLEAESYKCKRVCSCGGLRDMEASWSYVFSVPTLVSREGALMPCGRIQYGLYHCRTTVANSVYVGVM